MNNNMTSTDNKLKRKTAVATVIYSMGSVIAGGSGTALLVSDTAPILGIGLLLFGIAGFGWSCAAREWFFKFKK